MNNFVYVGGPLVNFTTIHTHTECRHGNVTTYQCLEKKKRKGKKNTNDDVEGAAVGKAKS
jgi:hypothetical protein